MPAGGHLTPGAASFRDPYPFTCARGVKRVKLSNGLTVYARERVSPDRCR